MRAELMLKAVHTVPELNAPATRAAKGKVRSRQGL